MEDMANKIVSYLYENITDSSGGSANALVCFYKTLPYDQLDQGLQGFAQGILRSAAQRRHELSNHAGNHGGQ